MHININTCVVPSCWAQQTQSGRGSDGRLRGDNYNTVKRIHDPYIYHVVYIT